MTLDLNMKAALRERLLFYRELGIGPLYLQEVGDRKIPDDVREPAQDVQPVIDVAEDTLLAAANDVLDRNALLREILDDIGPNCQRCKLAKLGRKQIVFGTGDPARRANVHWRRAGRGRRRPGTALRGTRRATAEQHDCARWA